MTWPEKVSSSGSAVTSMLGAGTYHLTFKLRLSGVSVRLREANFNMVIHAHRAMHAAFTRNQKHGMSMMVLADFARLVGVDQLHIGTAIGKLEGDIELVSELNDEIERKKVKERKKRLEQDWGKIKSVLSVSSGGLHPGHVPFLVKHLGNDLVIQMGGGIHGHPKGTRAGAKAAREAVEATAIGFPLKSVKNPELKEALKHWK